MATELWEPPAERARGASRREQPPGSRLARRGLSLSREKVPSFVSERARRPLGEKSEARRGEARRGERAARSAPAPPPPRALPAASPRPPPARPGAPPGALPSPPRSAPGRPGSFCLECNRKAIPPTIKKELHSGEGLVKVSSTFTGQPNVFLGHVNAVKGYPH